MNRFLSFGFGLLLSVLAAAQNEAPAPVAPLPTKHQVAWQQLETYAFIHFGPNTFQDREWGYGDAPLECFNPVKLDCEQWAKTIKAAGMKGIILTAKHHDGFCLWPSKYTDYSVRNTPWRDGHGDIVGELAAACKKYGLKLGLYLSPWDRHQAFYATPLYVEYFHAQLEELLTQYGEIFEVWFDGANGGDGYYGGAREERKIDRRTYYDFPRAHQAIYKHQPQAIIFSDGGPGCRWVGNERGYAYATNWSFLRIKEVYPGYEHYEELQSGHPDGDTWVPSECNTSIRPGWFYHESEDTKVKSVEYLCDLYYRSVGHNGTFLLNFPVDKDGLIHSTDSAHAVDFHKRILADMKDDLLLRGATIKASDTRGKAFSVKALTDGNYDTYWAMPDGMTTATLTFTLKKRQNVNLLKLQEYIPLGQRVRSFVVEYQEGKEWLPVRTKEETTTIGYRRLLRFATVTTKALRVRILDARGPVCFNAAGLYYAPNIQEGFSEKEENLKGYDFTTTPRDVGLLLDLGGVKTLSSFHYLPAQTGKVSNYELLAGQNPQELKSVAAGEFSNIRNNPIMQHVYFTPVKAQYLLFRPIRMVNEGEAFEYKKLVIQ